MSRLRFECLCPIICCLLVQISSWFRHFSSNWAKNSSFVRLIDNTKYTKIARKCMLCAILCSKSDDYGCEANDEKRMGQNENKYFCRGYCVSHRMASSSPNCMYVLYGTNTTGHSFQATLTRTYFTTKADTQKISHFPRNFSRSINRIANYFGDIILFHLFGCETFAKPSAQWYVECHIKAKTHFKDG